jgi:uncharacterized phage protein gp47/JayE
MARTVVQIVAEMLVDHKEITGVELSPIDFSRDEVISLYPIAGVIASLEAKVELTEDNFHPGTADEDGLEKHLASNQLPERRQPQKSQGQIKLLGDDGTSVPVGTAIKRKLDGKVYVSISSGVVAGGELTLSFEASQAGQEYNIDPIDEEFTLASPVTGIQNTCTNTSQFLNGRDLETAGEMLQRIQEKIRRENTGGNLPAYEAFAKEASPLVVTAKSIKHPRGVSTVDTVITSGTTDIEMAVEEGQPVLRLPSSSLIDVVQAYITLKCPTTDDHLTIAPTENDFDTTILLALFDESLRSKVVAEITKIWKVFVYTANPGQRIYPSDLEKLIDAKVGHLIKFRRVEDFSVDHYYEIGNTNILNPNSLTVDVP